MKLTLFDTENKYSDDFLDFINRYIIIKIISSINTRKIQPIEEYINQYSDIPTLFKKYISVNEVIISGAYNIIYSRINNKIVFEIDPTQIYSGTSAKLNELCKLINYGNLVVKGYPIFTKAFDYFKDNIDNYYDNYMQGGF